MTVLFNSAPDLLEDFKQFLPESAAQAKGQAAARQDDIPVALSNVRGEAGYGPASLQGQGGRDNVKMPPLGQFNVKDSAKESKKRRGGPGAQVGPSMGGPGAMDAGAIGGPAGKGQASQIGNVNKVSLFIDIFLFCTFLRGEKPQRYQMSWHVPLCFRFSNSILS